MHVAAILPHCVQLRVVEHFTECLELIFWRLLLFVALFLVKHAPESLEIGAVLHKTRDVDLRANEITEIPS
jgi:hypothetical protein